MCDDYLPAARTWVAERESAFTGFISVLRDKVVGALFVALAHQHAWVIPSATAQGVLRYPLRLDLPRGASVPHGEKWYAD